MRYYRSSLALVSVFGATLTIPGAAVAQDSQTNGKGVQTVEQHCFLPTNIRSKVEHCDQVGDFGDGQTKVYGDESRLFHAPLRSIIIDSAHPSDKGGHPLKRTGADASTQGSANTDGKAKETQQPSVKKLDVQPETAK